MSPLRIPISMRYCGPTNGHARKQGDALKRVRVEALKGRWRINHLSPITNHHP